MKYFLAIKKNEILPSVTAWISLEGIILSEISESEQDKYHGFSYMWDLKNKTNRQIKKKQTFKHREQTDGCQRGRELEDRMIKKHN